MERNPELEKEVELRMYLERKLQKKVATVENNFSYHEPKPGQNEKYAAIREKAKELAHLINMTVPESREQSLAMTKLEECTMWANAGIARN